MKNILCYFTAQSTLAYCATFALQASIYFTTLPVLAQDALEQSSIKSSMVQHSLLMDIEHVGNKLIAVGERGHILYSSDEAATWTQAEVPVRVTLTATFFISEQLGWAVGHDGVVLQSKDGGINWTKLLDGIQANALTLALAKKIFKSTEAALAKARQSENDADIETQELAFENAGMLLDDAESFVAEGPTRPFLDIWFKNENEGFVVGAFGLFLHTLDGGVSWTPWFDHIENTDLFHLNSIAQIGEQLFITAEAGSIYRSDDNGQQWTMLESPYEGSFFGINQIGNSSIIAYGLRGNAYVSPDKGETWQRVNIGVDASLFSSAKLADGSVAIVGAGGVMLFINDQGQLINTRAHPKNLPITGVVAGKNNILYTVGFGGARKITYAPKQLLTKEQAHE